MTKITIEIRCENAAFEESAQWEVGRILIKLGTGLQEGRITGDQVLRDVNGNRVGHYDTWDNN